MSKLVDSAAETLQRRIETLLNSRTEAYSLTMLSRLPSSCVSFSLIRTEQGFKVKLRVAPAAHNEDASLLHAELMSAIGVLEQAHRQLPAINIVEKLIIQLRTVICRLMGSSMPLARLQVVLKLLTGIQWCLLLRLKAQKEYRETRLLALSYLLQEPQQVLEKILRQHHYYFYWNYACRLTHLKNAEAGISSTKTFHWPERDAYTTLNNECNDSRVLVSIHMGDFFGAFKCIADALDKPRSVISLRREGDTDAIKALSPRHTERHQIFMHGKDNPMLIVKALRAGGQTLSVLFDLSADFGETAEVMFFGHKALFVRGPAELAIMGRATIYPFVCYSEVGGDRIAMEPAFTPELRAGETLREAVTRVTQRLVTMAERWIKQHPAQWKYLDNLPSYLLINRASAEQGDASHAR